MKFLENCSCKSGYRVKDTAPVSDHLGNLLQTVTRRSCLPNELEEGSSWRQGQDRGLEPLATESSLQKRIPSAKAHVSIAAGFCLLAQAQLRLFFHSSFIKNLRNYPLFF